MGAARVVPAGRHPNHLIEPGSRWETPVMESFNGRSRDGLLNVEEFGSVVEGRVVVEAWRIEYSTYRSHSALGGLTPAEFAPQWAKQHQLALSTTGALLGAPLPTQRPIWKSGLMARKPTRIGGSMYSRAVVTVTSRSVGGPLAASRTARCRPSRKPGEAEDLGPWRASSRPAVVSRMLPAVAFHELNAQLLAERRDGGGDRGRGHDQRCGRAPDQPGAGHVDERLEFPFQLPFG
jgi:hypothetical protein